MKNKIITATQRMITLGAMLACYATGVSNVAAQTTATPTPTAATRVWTIAEILAERATTASNIPVRYCQGGVFKPCVCPRSVPKTVQYRPAVKECGGKAAAILSGKYANVFSVVVRDRENKDRWPVNGMNGCTPYETNVLGLNKCSAFKVQSEVDVPEDEKGAVVYCFGASGYSTLFKRVTRMTAKISDIPGSTNDPLARWCLAGPDKPLN